MSNQTYRAAVNTLQARNEVQAKRIAKLYERIEKQRQALRLAEASLRVVRPLADDNSQLDKALKAVREALKD